MRMRISVVILLCIVSMVNSEKEGALAVNEIYYATGNATKFQEAQEFFQNAGTTISLRQYAEDIPEIQTLDQESIAISKAREAWQRLQKPVLAEDAGIYFPQYNQFPGTMTKFIYQALGMEGILKLVGNGDAAYMQMYLVYYYGPDQYRVFKEVGPGRIEIPQVFSAPKSVPFDDIFVPEGSDKNYTWLRQHNQFEAFNYRFKALKQFVDWYTNS